MAKMMKCDQCGRIEAEELCADEHWIATEQWHRPPHGGEECAAHHKIFCTWGCAGIWATARALIGE